MAKLSTYNLAFKGLGIGTHDFDYQIGKRFFEYFDGGIAEDGKVDVKLKLEKQSAFMVLKFQVKGTVRIPCDRCLELFDQPVKSQNTVFVKYGEENFEDGDDVIWIGPDDTQINVAKLIYDFIILSMPIKHVHPDDEKGNSLCDPEMLKKLNALSVSEKNDEMTDSRWNELKKLLGNK
jgi:uncharacterized metal-binding protein YceD (DUF177 family)